MQIEISAVGTKPLLLHNVDLANPRNPWFRKMAELRGTPSRSRTDKWLDEMEYAGFMGGFYDIPEIDGVAIPAENVRQCLIGAAKSARLGTKASGAIGVIIPAVQVMFTGWENLRKPEALWEDGRYKITRMIRGSGGASPTTYPMFSDWAVKVAFELDERIMNLSTLTQVAEQAGRSVGLGACRKQGYGRFTALVKTAASMNKAA